MVWAQYSQKLLMVAVLCWLRSEILSPSNAAQANSSVPKLAPGGDLFTNAVPRIRIHIAPSELLALRQSDREYVRAVVEDGSTTYQDVGIHLKGAIGSFRKIDEKPGLTLNFAKFRPDQRLHGLRKIHLNNSVEDGSYLNEALGSELFRVAGVPAPRVAHALVELNGRPLGLYLLKEGFTEDFLGLYFHQTNGALYEPRFGHDVDGPLKVVSGDPTDEQNELKALAAAAREPDLHRRWQRLRQVLDLDRFVSFMAVEVMAGHRDGYCLARNNFRVYHDLDTDKVLFFPHGMDQLFGKANAPMQPQMNGLIAKAVMETVEGRESYRQRFGVLLTNVFDVASLRQRADSILRQLRPVVTANEAHVIEREMTAVKERIAKRRRDLERQLSDPANQPLKFEDGIARLSGWRIVDPPANGVMELANLPGGKVALRIRAGPVTSASWRTKVRLPKGHYRFEGAVRTTGVEPLRFRKNNGASLRVLGKPRGEESHFESSDGWRTWQVPFEVTAFEEDLELLCELRARSGEAWFDLHSLRLVGLEMKEPDDVKHPRSSFPKPPAHD